MACALILTGGVVDDLQLHGLEDDYVLYLTSEKYEQLEHDVLSEQHDLIA